MESQCLIWMLVVIAHALGGGNASRFCLHTNILKSLKFIADQYGHLQLCSNTKSSLHTFTCPATTCPAGRPKARAKAGARARYKYANGEYSNIGEPCVYMFLTVARPMYFCRVATKPSLGHQRMFTLHLPWFTTQPSHNIVVVTL